MLRLEWRAKRFKINVQAFTDALRAEIERVMVRPALRAFVKTSLKLTPVDTGMAAGAFLLISRELRLPFPQLYRTSAKFAGQPIRRRVRYFNPGKEGHRRFKNPKLGASLTTLGIKSFVQGQGMVDRTTSRGLQYYLYRWEGNILSVKFVTGIRHFMELEEQWGNIAAGMREFAKVLRANQSKVKRVEGFLLSSEIRVTQAGIHRDPMAPDDEDMLVVPINRVRRTEEKF